MNPDQPKIEEPEKKQEGEEVKGKSKKQDKREAKQNARKKSEHDPSKNPTEIQGKTPKANPTPAQSNPDDLNADDYFEYRSKQIKKLKEDKNTTPYPHKFVTTHLIPELRAKFGHLKNESELSTDEVATAGRIFSMRAAGKNLMFYDLVADEGKIQIILNKQTYGNDDDYEHIKHHVKRGDIIGARGKIGPSKTGELSIFASFFQLLSPCLHMLPIEKVGLNDNETRYRQRYLDLIVNPSSRQIFKTRSKIISLLRDELAKREFLEVETPTLNLIPGGATAKPFTTNHNDLKLNMFLRIAPELFLKNCIVGGLNRVFEIGKNFRNEQMDPTHNPEFTACELYWAFADVFDLIDLTEEILSSIVFKIRGSYEIEVIGHDKKPTTISFQRPWKRINMMEELQKRLNIEKLPENLESEEATKFFDDLCKKHHVPCSNPRTTSRLIDKLVGEFIEPDCVNPTFLMEQPQLMCPLAKYHRSKPGLTERFELFINRKEFVNAYTELNDPFVQREQFSNQSKEKAQGNDEACEIDEDFVKCLEHGLPPTGGWGLGIDRFVMLLTDSQNIQEFILFPEIKPIKNEAQV